MFMNKMLLRENIDKIVGNVLKEYFQQRPDEYIKDVFNWDTFYNIENKNDRIEYCTKYFGEPLGDGLSRYVFQVDDYTVLKFESGSALQNRGEYDFYIEENKNPLLPKIYGHADDFSWLWVEKVIPMIRDENYKCYAKYDADAVNKDFRKLVGVPYYPLKTRKDKPSINGLKEWYCNNYRRYDSEYDYDKWDPIYKELISDNVWVRELVKMFEKINPMEFHEGNFGIAMRNGKPIIVVLDTGLAF